MWVKKKAVVKEGDCILIVKQKNGSFPVMRPSSQIAIVREDSFYSQALNDTVWSHYSCEKKSVVRLWRMVDSVSNCNMEVIILRADTIFCQKLLGCSIREKTKDTIAFNTLVKNLKKVYVREYRFKDRALARMSFRKLAFDRNVVLRGDTNWLHGDGGKFAITVSWDADSQKMLDSIRRAYQHDVYSLWYQEQRGVIWVECDKAFYDKFNLYQKSDFQRPKKFSFVIYTKAE